MRHIFLLFEGEIYTLNIMLYLEKIYDNFIKYQITNKKSYLHCGFSIEIPKITFYKLRDF